MAPLIVPLSFFPLAPPSPYPHALTNRLRFRGPMAPLHHSTISSPACSILTVPQRSDKQVALQGPMAPLHHSTISSPACSTLTVPPRPDKQVAFKGPMAPLTIPLSLLPLLHPHPPPRPDKRVAFQGPMAPLHRSTIFFPACSILTVPPTP